MNRFHGEGKEGVQCPFRVWDTRGKVVFPNWEPLNDSLSFSQNPVMKLTPELLAQAPSALNPTKERQLDLRGEQIVLSSTAFLQFAQRL